MSNSLTIAVLMMKILRSVRQKRKYTGDEMAAKLNMNPSNYRNLETFRVKLEVDRASLMCDILDIDFMVMMKEAYGLAIKSERIGNDIENSVKLLIK